MKKIGTLNTHLSRVIAQMGHTDRLVICDSGLPIPRGAEVVDLALRKNVPRFMDVVEVVMEELQVESAVVAREMERVNGQTYARLTQLLNGTPITSVSHEEFKQMTAGGGTIVFVRSGEATPYANVMLVAGVTFD
jgi:D-ribose pyranase